MDSNPTSSSRSLVAPGCLTALLLLAIAITMRVSAADAASDPKSDPSPKHVIVPKLTVQIKLDGELNESVRSKAVVLKPFYKNDGSGREREQTEVRLWYDDQALYLGWRCQ